MGEPRSLVLASGSPRRQQLFDRFDLSYLTCVSGSDETLGPDDGADPTAAATRLATTKCRDVLATCPADHRLVVAADTMVVFGGSILNKPASEAQLRAFLAGYSGASIDVLTAVAIGSSLRDPVTEAVVTRVDFVAYDLDDAGAYVASGEGYDKAGGLSLQGGAGRFVESIDGCWCNVVGLPLCATRRLLDQFGVEAPPSCTTWSGDRCPNEA